MKNSKLYIKKKVVKEDKMQNYAGAINFLPTDVLIKEYPDELINILHRKGINQNLAKFIETFDLSSIFGILTIQNVSLNNCANEIQYKMFTEYNFFVEFKVVRKVITILLKFKGNENK